MAEGVEIDTEKDFVQQCGIDICQGFYFAKLMSPDDILTWIDTVTIKKPFLCKSLIYQSNISIDK